MGLTSYFILPWFGVEWLNAYIKTTCRLYIYMLHVPQITAPHHCRWNKLAEKLMKESTFKCLGIICPWGCMYGNQLSESQELFWYLMFCSQGHIYIFAPFYLNLCTRCQAQNSPFRCTKVTQNEHKIRCGAWWYQSCCLTECLCRLKACLEFSGGIPDSTIYNIYNSIHQYTL